MPTSHNDMTDDETRRHPGGGTTDRLLRLLADQNDRVLAEQHELRKDMNSIKERLAGGQSSIETIPDIQKNIAELVNRTTVIETRLAIMWWVIGVASSTVITAAVAAILVVMGHHP